MASNKDFIDSFQQQIQLLKDLEQTVQGAIGRAEDRLKQMQAGKSVEEVFGAGSPKK